MTSFKSRRWRLLLVPAIAIAAVSTFGSPQNLMSEPTHLRSQIAKAASATFEIKCDDYWAGTGWGIELDGESFVVTAQHVVEDCLNGEFIGGRNDVVSFFSLELVVADGSFWGEDGLGWRDLALLSASKPIPNFKFQEEPAGIGQWVMAIGYPLNSSAGPLVNITQGNITGFDDFGFIVTDAAINYGNSGGPLVNSRGEVVATIFSSEDNAEADNLAYGQGIAEHCDFVFDCLSGISYTLIWEE